MEKKIEWKRNCSKCGEKIFYSTKYVKIRAEKRNKKCRSCAMTERPISEKTRKKLKELAKLRIGNRNPFFRKKHTEETRKKMRISAIKRIENTFGQISPNYNPNSISIIETEAKKYKISDLQHAENGGEYQVCGYFVDGYSPSKNVVIEYYEPFHKNQVEHDERRKNEIIKELGCKFIEIR
jgi:hypothetical protein